MMRRRFKRKKGPVQSKKVTVDGINFASGLEKYMYLALKEANIPADYEGETFVVMEGIDFTTTSYERCANGKGEFKDRGNKKILPIKYTPDFVGWKLFKNVVNKHHPHVILYKPQNHKECDETINLIQQQKSI